MIHLCVRLFWILSTILGCFCFWGVKARRPSRYSNRSVALISETWCATCLFVPPTCPCVSRIYSYLPTSLSKLCHKLRPECLPALSAFARRRESSRVLQSKCGPAFTCTAHRCLPGWMGSKDSTWRWEADRELVIRVRRLLSRSREYCAVYTGKGVLSEMSRTWLLQLCSRFSGGNRNNIA